MVTLSDPSQEDSEPIGPPRPRYHGQYKNYEAETSNQATMDWAIENFLDRQQELTKIRYDLIDMIYRYAIATGKSFITNLDQTYYVGPGAPTTKPQNKSGWILLIPINPKNKTMIKEAIRQMTTYKKRISADDEKRLSKHYAESAKQDSIGRAKNTPDYNDLLTGL